MNWTRFSFLLKDLRCDDKETRPHRRNFDKLAPIRELLGEVNSAYPKYYSASAFVAIKEKFYTLNMEVYVGRQPEGPYHLDTKMQALVGRICNVISKAGRNVATNNWFISIEFGKLLLEKNI